MTRIDEGMIQVKNLCPKDFKLEDLDIRYYYGRIKKVDHKTVVD